MNRRTLLAASTALLAALLVFTGCSSDDTSADTDSGSDLDTVVQQVVTTLDDLGIEHTDPVRREVKLSGAKASFDMTINGYDAGILVFPDADTLAAWQEASDGFGGIHVAFDNAALSLNSREGVANSAEIAPQIADAIGGEAHGASSSESTGTTGDEDAAEDLTAETGMTSGVDSINTRYTSAGALVTNPNADLAAYDVTVVFNLLDAAGATLDTDSAEVSYIPAGATVPVAPLSIGFDLPAEPAEVTVDVVGDFAEDTGWDGVDFMMGEGVDLEVGPAAIDAGEFGGSTLGFEVTNPSDTVVELATWDCVFQQGGTIVGGAGSGISDPVVPGGTVRVSDPLQAEGLTPDEITCRAIG